MCDNREVVRKEVRRDNPVPQYISDKGDYRNEQETINKTSDQNSDSQGPLLKISPFQ